MMDVEEYGDDFKRFFIELDLTLLDAEIKKEFFSCILEEFTQYFDFDSTILKDLRVLDISSIPNSGLKVWQSHSIRLEYLFHNLHDLLQKKFADFLTLDFTQFTEASSG